MECGRGEKYGLPHNSHWDIVAPRVAPVNVTSLFLKASRLRRKAVLVLTDAYPFQTVSELAACSCGTHAGFLRKMLVEEKRFFIFLRYLSNSDLQSSKATRWI